MNQEDISGRIEPLAFASADFNDRDAGSGSGSGSENIQSAVENILQFHMNEATAIVPDVRDFLRPWRKRLRDILANESEMLTMFLEKPLEDTSIVQRHSQFINTLSIPMFNTNSEWLKNRAEPLINNADILRDLEQHLGVSLSDTTQTIHKIMNQYLDTLKEMFRSIELLNMKIDKVEALKNKLLTIPLDDSESEELLNLKQAILSYIRAEYDANRIQEDYTTFCTQYARFSALRSVILALSVSANSADGPTCSICTTNRVCFALIPCGHTFCNECSQRQRHQCFICRTTLRERQRLYFI